MEDIVFSNASGKLCFHRQSLRGRVQDYVISFEDEVHDIELVLNKTLDLFQKLMNKFEDYDVKARLIAQVNYFRLNDQHEEVGQEDYHFASYQLEEVKDVPQFYQRHLQKVISRINGFHQNGSRLIINRIKHIHIQLCMKPKQS